MSSHDELWEENKKLLEELKSYLGYDYCEIKYDYRHTQTLVSISFENKGDLIARLRLYFKNYDKPLTLSSFDKKNLNKEYVHGYLEEDRYEYFINKIENIKLLKKLENKLPEKNKIEKRSKI